MAGVEAELVVIVLMRFSLKTGSGEAHWGLPRDPASFH
jgi:hypothetical protein